MTNDTFNKIKYSINKHSKLITHLSLLWFSAAISIWLATFGKIYTVNELIYLVFRCNKTLSLLTQIFGTILMFYAIKTLNEKQHRLNSSKKDTNILIQSLFLSSFLGWYVLSNKIKYIYIRNGTYIYYSLKQFLTPLILISMVIITMIALIPFMDNYTKFQIKRLRYTLIENNILLFLYIAMNSFSSLQVIPIIELSIILILFAFLLYYLVSFYEVVENSYNILSVLIFIDTIFIYSILIDKFLLFIR